MGEAAGPAIVGRRRELEQLAALIERRAPALVLVAGPAGTGKSTVIRAAQPDAEADGWTMLPAAEATELVAGSATTPESFAATVWAHLDVVPAGDPVTGLAPTLADRAPLLVTLDVFRPTDAFATWLVGDLMAELRSSSAPVVLAAMTAFDSDERLLRPAADLLLRLGPLDTSEVRAALNALGPLDPPLVDDELNVYVREGSSDPAVLASLLRLLPQTASGAS